MRIWFCLACGGVVLGACGGCEQFLLDFGGDWDRGVTILKRV